MSLRERILELPGAYRLLGRVASLRKDSRVVYARRYLHPRPGDRVLDLGCGPGDILSALPDCRYVGVDLEPRYIDAARKRWGSRGEFHCMPLADYVLTAARSFDLVMANGVLHHLDDVRAAGMLELAARAMKDDGRTVTLDGCYVAGQSRIARTLLRWDRGQFVRYEPAYLALARAHFGDVQAELRHDLLLFPYTLIVMTCRRAAADQAVTR